tara:strand:+ start:425 stop:919 length:495 start_codon:yes stop_codon:yes gene_type:complete
MSKFLTYNETLTSALTGGTTYDHRELSGRPTFTAGNTYITLACGFSGTRYFEGYNFDSLEGVMLSTIGGLDILGLGSLNIAVSSTVSSLSYLSGGATISPALTGFFLSQSVEAGTGGTYTLNNYNVMSVTFPTITATGIVDVVPINQAGFARLGKDINTTITIN